MVKSISGAAGWSRVVTGGVAALATLALFAGTAGTAHADPPRHAKAYGYYKNKDKKGDRNHYRSNDYRWGNGDRDRDGIRDRYDRYPSDPRNGRGIRRDRDRDNDGIRNRRDRDRDGDGIRNRRDRFPNGLRRP